MTVCCRQGWNLMSRPRKILAMSTEMEELIRICEALPEAKRAEVADFARYLLDRQDDERWERIIGDPTRRPKLEAFIDASRAEGGEKPLDLDRL